MWPHRHAEPSLPKHYIVITWVSSQYYFHLNIQHSVVECQRKHWAKKGFSKCNIKTFGKIIAQFQFKRLRIIKQIQKITKISRKTIYVYKKFWSQNLIEPLLWLQTLPHPSQLYRSSLIKTKCVNHSQFVSTAFRYEIMIS
jgi:hypothetical protein